MVQAVQVRQQHRQQEAAHLRQEAPQQSHQQEALQQNHQQEVPPRSHQQEVLPRSLLQEVAVPQQSHQQEAVIPPQEVQAIQEAVILPAQAHRLNNLEENLVGIQAMQINLQFAWIFSIYVYVKDF